MAETKSSRKPSIAKGGCEPVHDHMPSFSHGSERKTATALGGTVKKMEVTVGVLRRSSVLNANRCPEMTEPATLWRTGVCAARIFCANCADAVSTLIGLRLDLDMSHRQSLCYVAEVERRALMEAATLVCLESQT